MLNEYFGVEVLRALRLRERNKYAWKRVTEFEPHCNARSNDYRAKAATDFIITFIRDKCNLADEYSSETIEHVVGILSINTFWAYKDLNRYAHLLSQENWENAISINCKLLVLFYDFRYASCLFDKITLLAHDCDPNTERKLIFCSEDNECSDDAKTDDANDISRIALRITASRKIVPGEMITIRYIDVNQPLAKRREELKETFYFDCTCSRCLTELTEASNFIEEKLHEFIIN